MGDITQLLSQVSECFGVSWFQMNNRSFILIGRHIHVVNLCVMVFYYI